MKKRKVTALMMVAAMTALAAGSALAEETRSVADANGNEVEIPVEVTAVAPAIGAFSQVTEMLSRGKIVAAATANISEDFKAVFTDYVESNPNDYDSSSVEDLIAAGAQVVYGPAVVYSEEQLQQMENAGIAFVAVNNIADSASMMNSYRLIGDILGEDAPERAERYCEYYQASITDCQERTADIAEEDKVQVLKLVVADGAYSTVNRSDIFTSIVEEAGGVNVAADYESQGGGGNGGGGNRGPQGAAVDAEQIVAWDPQIIITMSQDAAEEVKNDPVLADVAAVKDEKVFASPMGLYLWGVRSGENAMMTPWLGQLMYPELFGDIDMEQIVIDFYADWYDTEITAEEADDVLDGVEATSMQR